MPHGRAIRVDASQPDAEETSRWKRPVCATLIALLLGAAAGVIAALFLTVVEAEGLVIPFAS